MRAGGVSQRKAEGELGTGSEVTVPPSFSEGEGGGREVQCARSCGRKRRLKQAEGSGN